MRLKELRKEAGMTQAEFANHFEIPKKTVENWEQGVNKCPAYVEKLLVEKMNEIIQYINMKKLNFIPEIMLEEWDKLEWEYRETGAHPSPEEFWIEGYNFVGWAIIETIGINYPDYLFQKNGQLYIYRQHMIAKVILKDKKLYAGEGTCQDFYDIGKKFESERIQKKLSVREFEGETYIITTDCDERLLFALRKRGCKYYYFGYQFIRVPLEYKDDVEEVAKWRGYILSDKYKEFFAKK